MKTAYVLALIFLALGVQAQESDPGSTCVRALVDGPASLPLRGKVSFDGKYSPAMLTLASKATELERKAINEITLGAQACDERGALWRAKNLPPEFIALRSEFMQSEVLAAADLYSRKWTYGEYNRDRLKYSQEHQQKLAAAVSAFAQRRAQGEERIQSIARAASSAEAAERQQRATLEAAERQRQADIQEARRQRDENEEVQARIRAQEAAARDAEFRRQAALQMLLQRPQNSFQPIPFQPIPIRPTVNTNCQRIGDQVTCQTR